MYKIALFFAFFSTILTPCFSHTKYEVRATWLTTLGGMDWPSQKANSPAGIQRQQEELRHILDRLKAANFNTVLFQTRLRGDVIYPSYLESFSECLTGHSGKSPHYDPLQFAIEECHKRGMALHAWVVTIPIGSKRQVKLLGNKSVVARHPSLCKEFKGNWYLDPGEPGSATYLSHIIKEIVARYDIDGIHFDYIRYPEQGKRFPDYQSYRKYGHKKPINQWRRENITRIVRQLYNEIKSLKPWVIVSSSPIGKFNDTKHYRSQGWNAYQEVHQDAQAWLREGIHDALFPMMYFRDNHFYPFALDWQENKNQRWIVPGLGIYFLETKGSNWTLDDVIRQIHFTRNHKFEGQAYFRNQFLLNNVKGIGDKLEHYFYTTPAVTPPLTWIDSIAPSAPTIVSFTEKGGTDSTYHPRSVTIQWRPSVPQKAGGISYRIYASNTYPVDTYLGENIIATNISDSIYTYTVKLPWQKKQFWAVTAVDRYGNESVPVECNQESNKSLKLFDNELPYIPKGNKLIISDLIGNEIIRSDYPGKHILNQLTHGVYRISLLTPDGSKKLIGTLIR